MRKIKIKKITDKIYKQYGSGTGILFGIPSELHLAVQEIVDATIDIIEEEKDEY